MSDLRLFPFALFSSVAILILTAAFCVNNDGGNNSAEFESCVQVEDFLLASGCGCPVDSSSYYSTGLMRSSLYSYLSKDLAQSIAEKKLSLFLTRGGNGEMQNRRSKSEMNQIDRESDPDISEKVRRAQERIELAKKVISEQEMSSKLEYLKMRCTRSRTRPES